MSIAMLKICIGHFTYEPMNPRMKTMLAMKLFSGIQTYFLGTYIDLINKFSLISQMEINFIISK